MNSAFIKANDIQFHYVSKGEGKLILLLHGFPEFWYSWKKVIPLLSQNHKVVAIDMRGYGQSDKPQAVADYNYKILTKDIAEIISALGYDKAYIVGHDWGGGIAWEFAKLYPKMTEKLIVLNCPPAARLMREIFTNIQQFKMSWYIFFFQLPFLPQYWLYKNRDTFFWRAMRGKAYNKDNFKKEDIEQYMNAFRHVEDFVGPINYYRAALRALADKTFRGKPVIEADILIIWGTADSFLHTNLLQGIEQYGKKKVSVQLIPQCSHWVQQEQPELVAQYILNFLKE